MLSLTWRALPIGRRARALLVAGLIPAALAVAGLFAPSASADVIQAVAAPPAGGDGEWVTRRILSLRRRSA